MNIRALLASVAILLSAVGIASAQTLEEQMREAAANMDFELAATLRDQLFEVRARKDNKPKAGAGRGR